MVGKTDNQAPCQSSELWSQDKNWDITPELSTNERKALADYARCLALGKKGYHTVQVRRELTRLIIPLKTALKWMNAARTPSDSVIHNILIEMHCLNKPYWLWTEDQWVGFFCPSEGEFHIKFGASGNCRQYAIALAWLLCDFGRLELIGRFFQYRLCLKVFGKEVTDKAIKRIQDSMKRWGYNLEHDRNLIRNALCMVMLCQRESDPEKLKIETFKRVIEIGPAYMRTTVASLSRILSDMNILPKGIDHRIDNRRRPNQEYRAITNVPEEWLMWCQKWNELTIRSPSSQISMWYRILQCGRWLAVTHPDMTSPANWSREIAIEYTAEVSKLVIGKWSDPRSMYKEKHGNLMKPSARAAVLQSVRIFFRDLQEWGLIPVNFNPDRVFQLPRSIRSKIGPDPRVVPDDIWSKLVWAGINLKPEDFKYGKQLYYRYPFNLAKTVCIFWLFSGLRLDEIIRMRVGCIHWVDGKEKNDHKICILHVPINKTSKAFNKPVDYIIGEYVEIWEKERGVQPQKHEEKTGEIVNYLFMYKGNRISRGYINNSIIPLLCRKAGVPLEDARGPITSHRARATIASQLFNSKESISIFELQQWLGHTSPQTTQHYLNITPTKLAGSLLKAGYFERNRRMISVLIDQDIVKAGTNVSGEAWRYYDLGHGLCSYDFFEQCPHRMACAKCSFYVPKESSKAQTIEAKSNLMRMLQEIPLTDTERAAVEDGVQAMDKLIKELKKVPTPDKS